MLTVERGGYAHTRMAAALQLSAAVHTLVTILDDFRRSPSCAPSNDTGSLPARASSPSGSPHPLPSAPTSPPSSSRPSDLSAATAFTSLRLDLRRAENARRAAFHLYRLSRITPIDEDRIAHARALSHATGARTQTTAQSRHQFHAAMIADSAGVSVAPGRGTPPQAPLAPTESAKQREAKLAASYSSRLSDSFAERPSEPTPRAGPQDRGGLPPAFPSPSRSSRTSRSNSSPPRSPADLVRAATGPPALGAGSR